MLYFIQVIESISAHRFVPIFRIHVKLRIKENKSDLKNPFSMRSIYYIGGKYESFRKYKNHYKMES